MWNRVRPFYQNVLDRTAPGGILRRINGTDSILVAPSQRDINETYEPAVWRELMDEVQIGDTVADVGAYRGLYSIAIARRVGSVGRVVSFEPDSKNFSILETHIQLNRVGDTVQPIQAAAGAHMGAVFLSSNLGESHVVAHGQAGASEVICVTLDSIFASRKVDLIKIDVEGYEEHVIRGAKSLLADEYRSPRAIYIEVHPFAWQAFQSSSESLFELLQALNYQVLDLQNKPINHVNSYGEIVARKNTKTASCHLSEST
ncbi:MAG: FkbM family methyltransferase [Pyrinomonadaceae bacterium]